MDLADVGKLARAEQQPHDRGSASVATHLNDQDANRRPCKVDCAQHRQLLTLNVEHEQINAAHVERRQPRAERCALDRDATAVALIHDALVSADAPDAGTARPMPEGARRVLDEATLGARGLTHVQRGRSVDKELLRQAGLPLDQDAPPAEAALEEPSVGLYESIVSAGLEEDGTW